MSRYFDVEDDHLQRSRLTNTRVIRKDLIDLRTDLETAFQRVQNDVDTGSGGGGAPLEFPFAAASQWVVNHNLGRAVHTEVLSAGGARIGVEVRHISPNQLRVYFDAPTPGKVVVR